MIERGENVQIAGSIEVICGPMFAGKTEELIRRLRRAKIAGLNIVCFKPILDNRYSFDSVISHDGSKIEAITLESSVDMWNYIDETTDVVAIDEAQFFDNDIVEYCQILANKGIRVILSGLDNDFRGLPFGPMPRLISIAEYVTKLTAVCIKCKMPASRTQRLVDGVPAKHDDDIIKVGAKESYEARCRSCHEMYYKLDPRIKI